MAPQFNLLRGRFDVVGENWALASFFFGSRKEWAALYVRTGSPAHVDRRRVKGVELAEYN